MLGYLDFFLGGDEKRPDLPPRLRQRFPMSLIFGGDGSYMAPFSLHSDSVLTSLMSQAVPSWIWHRLVAGLNAQLRLVRSGNLKVTFLPVIEWLDTHANPSLAVNGIRVDLAWFQATALGYCQLGLVVYAVEGEQVVDEHDGSPRIKLEQHTLTQNMLTDIQQGQATRVKDALMRKRITGGVLDSNSLRTLKDRRDLFYPFSLILHNTKPVGHQVFRCHYFCSYNDYGSFLHFALIIVLLFLTAGSCWFSNLNTSSRRFQLSFAYFSPAIFILYGRCSLGFVYSTSWDFVAFSCWYKCSF
jgi:hypothetical protein